MLNTRERHWQRYLKVTPTRARLLSQGDYLARSGIIHTREGDAPFLPGDYLALDTLGEYPISQKMIQLHYVRHSANADEAGFTLFLPVGPRYAIQLDEAFPTDQGLAGQPGDYLLRGQDGRSWPCARSKFEQEYRQLEEHLLYSIGYLNPNALDLLQARVDSGAIIVDIRLLAGSRYRPDFSGKRLRERFGSAYLRAMELGNKNYNRSGAPIVFVNPEKGIARLLTLLEQYDVCLLCRCQRFSTCHSAMVVAELLHVRPGILFTRLGEQDAGKKTEEVNYAIR
jgi:hypothetical protein